MDHSTILKVKSAQDGSKIGPRSTQDLFKMDVKTYLFSSSFLTPILYRFGSPEAPILGSFGRPNAAAQRDLLALRRRRNGIFAQDAPKTVQEVPKTPPDPFRTPPGPLPCSMALVFS